MKTTIYIVALTAFLASCKKAEPEAKVNVRELNQQFINAWNNKNSAALDTLLADDVHFLQGEVHYNGRGEVSQKWIRETMGTIADLKVFPVSSGADTQMAYEGGTFSVDVLPTGPGQPHAEGEGNFMLVWKKNDKGAWKLSYAQLEDLPVEAKNY